MCVVRVLTASSPQDQEKIRRAIANQRVDSSDIPLTAKAATSTTIHTSSFTSQVPAPSQKKRKAVPEQVAHTTSTKPAVPATIRSNVDDDDEVTIIEPDPIDELYCTLSTSIVGVQYYKGGCSRRFLAYTSIDVAIEGLVASGEEVRLIREPLNEYDRYVSLCIVTELLANSTPEMPSRS